MSLWLVAIGVWLITSAAWFVILLNMGTNWEQKVKILKAQRFSLEQALIDCQEGQTQPVWQLKADGVDVILERGRPDLYKIETDEPLPIPEEETE